MFPVTNQMNHTYINTVTGIQLKRQSIIPARGHTSRILNVSMWSPWFRKILLNKYSVDCHDIFYRLSELPENESLLFSPSHEVDIWVWFYWIIMKLVSLYKNRDSQGRRHYVFLGCPSVQPPNSDLAQLGLIDEVIRCWWPKVKATLTFLGHFLWMQYLTFLLIWYNCAIEVSDV